MPLRRNYDHSAPGVTPSLASTRLFAIAGAIETAGFDCVPVVYRDDVADQARLRLSALDAVLVWVNPIERHGDRRGRTSST